MRSKMASRNVARLVSVDRSSSCFVLLCVIVSFMVRLEKQRSVERSLARSVAKQASIQTHLDTLGSTLPALTRPSPRCSQNFGRRNTPARDIHPSAHSNLLTLISSHEINITSIGSYRRLQSRSSIASRGISIMPASWQVDSGSNCTENYHRDNLHYHSLG